MLELVPLMTPPSYYSLSRLLFSLNAYSSTPVGDAISNLVSSNTKSVQYLLWSLSFLALHSLVYTATGTALFLLHISSSLVKPTSCSNCGSESQDIFYLVLDCYALDSVRLATFGHSLTILDLWSRHWGLPDYCNSAELIWTLLGMGRVSPPSRARAILHYRKGFCSAYIKAFIYLNASFFAQSLRDLIYKNLHTDHFLKRLKQIYCSIRQTRHTRQLQKQQTQWPFCKIIIHKAQKLYWYDWRMQMQYHMHEKEKKSKPIECADNTSLSTFITV